MLALLEDQHPHSAGSQVDSGAQAAESPADDDDIRIHGSRLENELLVIRFCFDNLNCRIEIGKSKVRMSGRKLGTDVSVEVLREFVSQAKDHGHQEFYR